MFHRSARVWAVVGSIFLGLPVSGCSLATDFVFTADAGVADVGEADTGCATLFYRDVDGDNFGNMADSVAACAAPEGFVEAEGDCNDADGAIHPGATEVCDGVDNNCVDGVDEGVATTFYADLDGDTFGDPAAPMPDCELRKGFVANADDCDDADAAVHPGAIEATADEVDANCDGAEFCYADGDGDRYRTSVTIDSADSDCDDEGEASRDLDSGDCDDDNAGVHPGAAEIVGDGIDQDCNLMELCFVDEDDDHHRLSATVISADVDCSDEGEGVTSDEVGDCDDTNASIFPGASEVIGDEVDQNCDGDELCFVDADGDGRRLSSTVVSVDLLCNGPGEAARDVPTGDCDDLDPETFSGGASEIVADGVDQDCDGGDLCYNDADDDGYRVTSTVASSDLDCTDSGEAMPGVPTGDCVDSDPNTFPGAAELESSSSCRTDADGDGYGTATPGAGVTAGGDCDDGLDYINPGAEESVGDEEDYDCNGREVCYVDADADSFRTTATVPSLDLDCGDAGEATRSAELDCADTSINTYPGAAENESVESCRTDDDGDGYGSVSPASGATAGTDCDDNEGAAFPGAVEGVGDGYDQNCDGQETCYVDFDDDSFRLLTTVLSTDIDCADSGEALASDDSGDCVDTNAAINPAATELVGDEVDQNCDLAELCYADVDSDNYRTEDVTDSDDSDCSDLGEARASTPGGDCENADSAIHPGATEIVGNEVDDNCDSMELCYRDVDLDGFRTSTTVVSADNTSCGDVGEAAASLASGDCDDGSAAINPDALEICGGVDEDCDGEPARDCTGLLALGDAHTCVVRKTGAVACWGSNASGQYGNGATSVGGVAPVASLGTDLSFITSNASTSLGVEGDGQANTWGPLYSPLLGPTGAFASGALSTVHGCALRTDGTVACFGANVDGALGDAGGGLTLVDVVPGVTGVTSVSTGEAFSCAAHDRVSCWGRNGSGQLGVGATSASEGPGDVGIVDAVAVTSGLTHTCALLTDRSLLCWGAGGAGQLGQGVLADSYSPTTPVGFGPGTALQVAAGDSFTCALRVDGSVSCWGENSAGQLGNGGSSTSDSPVDVIGLTNVIAIGAGAAHACAVQRDGAVTCWGQNTSGELGNGSFNFFD